MQKNYVSVNTKYFKASAIQKIAEHNNRISDIDYLLDEKYHQFENTNYIFKDSSCENVGGAIALDEDGSSGIGTYADNLKKMKSTSISHSNFKHSTSLQKKFQALQKEKTKRLRKYYKYKPNENENEIIESVVSLSEEQALNYLKKGISFDEAIKEYMQQIKKIYGLEPISFQGHFDEGWIEKKVIDGEIKSTPHYNIHFHCQFYNFDFEKDKTVLRNLRKKDWEDMQDIAQASFQKYNLDFVRGESKEITGKEHLERTEYAITKKLDELKELYTLINQEKKQLKELKKQVSKDTNIYKVLNTNIKSLQQQEKQTRATHKDIQKLLNEKKAEVQIVEETIENHNEWLNETKQGIKAFLKEHLSKNKDSKYEINNMKIFYDEIVDLAIYLTNYDVKIKESQELKATNMILREKIEQLQNTFSLDAKQKDELNSKIEQLILKKDDLEEENYWYKKFIDEQNKQEEYNSFMQEQTKEKKLEEIEM